MVHICSVSQRFILALHHTYRQAEFVQSMTRYLSTFLSSLPDEWRSNALALRFCPIIILSSVFNCILELHGLQIGAALRLCHYIKHMHHNRTWKTLDSAKRKQAKGGYIDSKV